MSNSHIRIKNEYYRTPEFIKFDKSVKATVYRFLLSAVIRESSYTKDLTFGGHYIYTQHYLKGELVCRYPQEKMKEYLQTSQSRLSTYLAELEQDGLIQIIRRKVPWGTMSYYKVGYWTGEIGKASYQETLWFDKIFTAYYEVAKAQRDELRKQNPDPKERISYAENIENMTKTMEEISFVF